MSAFKKIVHLYYTRVLTNFNTGKLVVIPKLVLISEVGSEMYYSSFSPHTLRPQFLHRALMNLDQLGDVLVCVCGAHKPMMG